jgi:hypothetical protein
MNFFGDLDSMTITLTVLTLVVSLAFFAFLADASRNKMPVKIGRPFAIPLVLVFACFAVAYDAYCPDADQPHIQVTGAVVPIRLYTYHAHKSVHTGLIACVDPCGGESAPLMKLDDLAKRQVDAVSASEQLTLVYLGRTDEVDIGDSQSMIAHPVVEVSSAYKGARLFYIDTTRHWSRVILLLADGLFGILAFIIFLRMVHSIPATEADGTGNSASEGMQATPNELTSLGMGADSRREP